MFYQTLKPILDIAFPTAAVLFLPALFVFSYFHDKREYGKQDDEKIYELSKFSNCSEFDIFILAGTCWNVSEQRIEYDFSEYINGGIMPFYARDFIRSTSAEEIKQRRKPIHCKNLSDKVSG